jgi:Cu(I)/Ag(I) efflux system membrane protein CusA/SilA
MINSLIVWSIKNRLLVLLFTLIVSIVGIHALITRPIDAIPDLSDVQVIIRTSFEGQSPQVIEDQITYPISSAMMSVPGSKSVRGYSFFGDSFVYVIFDDDTDMYWARSRVLEYLNQVSQELPEGISPTLGPDATGVGWIYQYALVDRTGQHDLSELRSIQDWLLKYELQTVPGIAEIATVGGMVKQYQIVVDPYKLRGYYLTMKSVQKAIENSNNETGGSAIEIAEAEYMVRFKGYIKGIKDIGLTSIPTIRRRLSISSVLLDDVAIEIKIGPAMRRGVADLNGEGEVVGGIAIMRQGYNSLETIAALKKKLESLKSSLPDGVEIVETYNRSTLIKNSVKTLTSKIIEEFLILMLVCVVFLFHIRSSLVVLISLPVGILAAFIIMKWQGVNANIMSLGGIAIAIGTMMDAAIVMIENVHKHIEREQDSGIPRITSIQNACIEVGPSLFFSLLIITLSFLPIFVLEAQEARLFEPLAYTKTYTMAAAAGLSVTLVPAMIVFFIKGKITSEQKNPINRWLINTYKPIIKGFLNRPKFVSIVSIILLLSTIIPITRLGSEFMPELDEGDLLYMPTTLPGISIGKARQLLQQTDRMIKTVPEVKQVFGKVGRAETATDPAPLTMIESTIQLKPKDQWREGMTMDKIKAELDKAVQVPSLNNAWLMPIKTRIDMQSTGINTPLGIKIAGEDLAVIQEIGQQIEAILTELKGTKMVYSDRTKGARYLDIEIDRQSAAHYGLSINEIQQAASVAIAGRDFTMTVEGRERYPVNVRYPQYMRNSISKLKELSIVVTEDVNVQLQDLADVRVVDGAPMIKSENGRINGWVYITIDGTDIGSYINKAQQLLAEKLKLPTSYTISWTGQYEYMQRTKAKLTYIIPFTILIIFTLLFISFNTVSEALMVILTIPFALVGGLWMVYLLGYNFSIAVAVGFIAIAGIAAEFGVVMIIYLRQAIKENKPKNSLELMSAVVYGAAMRVRPKAMTIIVIVIGLMPIMLSHGTGSELMRRIAAPMIGGMITAPLVSMIVIPVLYFYWNNKFEEK